jgi:YesN/AraC family two-component response regulator
VLERLNDWKDGIMREASQLLSKKEEQDFDILVIDVRLPGKTGVQVLREVKESKPYIESIVIRV